MTIPTEPKPTSPAMTEGDYEALADRVMRDYPNIMGRLGE